jgi:uncharacterized protein with PIN domain
LAVPCPGCGRTYDVTLFEFGRTLWCTCGRRVGLEPRVRAGGLEPPRRFLADAMLGKLARWLRLLGFDCEHDAAIADEDLVRRGIQEERAILTRDRALADEWWVSGIHRVEAEKARDQLVEVLRRFGLEGEIRLFSRCAACNRPLASVSPEDVRGRVPAGVLESNDSFVECPACRRVYWQGSHTDRFRRFVGRLLEPD